MKVMYVASRADNQQTLLLEREITELQQRSFIATGEAVSFEFFPDLAIEDFPAQLSRSKPDILHIAAHGSKSGLALANASRKETSLDAGTLTAFLDGERIPRLVYLNACDSHEIAQELTKLVPMAIGTTAPITNRAARAAAVLFYDRLISGLSVDKAFQAGRKMIEAIERGGSSSQLFCSEGVDPAMERLYQLPRIVARFVNGRVTPDKNGEFKIELGMIGCRQDTIQVVFFTDDETYVGDWDDMEIDLCLVARTAPVQGVIWSDYPYWESYGDFRIYAVGSTASGSLYSASSTLCEALEAMYQHFERRGPMELPEKTRKAIALLRAENGAGFRYLLTTRRKKQAKKVKAKPIAKTAPKDSKA